MHRLFILLIAATLSLTAPAQANTLSQMLKSMGLSPDDIAIMSEQAASLYVSSAPKLGNTTDWENPDTGARGKVAVARIQGNCVVLRHEFQTRRRPAPQPIELRRCKQPDGNWVLS